MDLRMMRLVRSYGVWIGRRRLMSVMASSALCLASILGLGGCATSSTVTVQSVAGSRLEVTPTRSAFVTSDGSTTEIYLTDLSREELEAEDFPSQATGNIIHISVFLKPRASRTPISTGSCTAAFRHVILAGGQAGEYAGGGFVTTDQDSEARELRARFTDATLRLVGSTSGFKDRLGSSVVSGSFQASLEPATARMLTERLEQVVTGLTLVKK